ncbi:MAG TPA: hypothetical protein VFJ86_10845 [Usitatibacter sp.]|jgi:hypothetical protein|nr:hypothetical protein [Usitatibacter sp.]
MTQLIRATTVAAAALALGTLAACDRDAGSTPAAATPDASAQTINVAPAPPTGDPPGTTPVTGNQSELTEHQSQSQMPLEGQNHNYSSVAPQQSQKPGAGHAPSEGDNAKPDSGQPSQGSNGGGKSQ